MPVAPRYRYRYVNYVGMDGNLHVRDPLAYSAFEHPMLKAGYVPRHLSSRQRQYQRARLIEVQRAIIQMEQYKLAEADPDTILVSLT